jgi:hypothetical protein
MSASSLGLFFIVVFITCITPGAGVLYTLKNAINYGKMNAFFLQRVTPSACWL